MKPQPSPEQLQAQAQFLANRKPVLIRHCDGFTIYRDTDGHICTIGRSCPWYAETIAALAIPKPVKRGYNKLSKRRHRML